MSATVWAGLGIALPPGTAGELDTTCPQCSPTRKKRRDNCLSVNTETGAYYCHHCGWSGRLGTPPNSVGYGAFLRQRVEKPVPPRVYVRPKPPTDRSLPPQIVAWFDNRGIPQSVLIDAGISAGQQFCPQVRRNVLAIRFPYRRDGALVNIKYRTLDKHFWIVKGAQRILYGLDDIADAESVCLVEGEIDRLSIMAAGGPPTASVPDGAPPPDATHYASKFAFLDEPAMAHLRAATTVLIGTDMDAPGERLADELARRIGYGYCRRVSWYPCKDANELLVAQGAQSVLAALARALPFPVPQDGAVPPVRRPIRVLPPVRGRRPVVELSGGEVRHAS